MSLRNQPYIPLFVDDLLTDEKLSECSAKSTGVYIKIMCLMHKSEDYGKILLKQKDKIGANNIENFAFKLIKHLPFSKTIIEESLRELIEEKVLYIENECLCQKRMIKDNSISLIRSEVGKKGGEKTQFAIKVGKAKHEANNQDNALAKEQANTGIEIGIVNEYKNKVEFKNYIEKFNLTKKSNYRGDQKSERQFNSRIKEGFTIEQMIKSLENAMKANYHIETNFNYLTPEFFTRSDKINLYLNCQEIKEINEKPKSQAYQPLTFDQ
jgi:hypothetical protein